MSIDRGWIGVDLDGTLAEYRGWVDEFHIGEPVPAMADRVRQWIKEQRDVRIFTARACSLRSGRDRVISCIQDWTEKHFGKRLPVTSQKDYAMEELWDDRAVQVEKNTGRRMDGKP